MARALILALLIAFGGIARADDAATAAAIDAQVAKGKQLFDDQEYAGAVQTLVPVTRDVRATRTQRLHALELIALAQYIKGDLAAARGTFERIIDIDPGYQLSDASGSPKIKAFFEDLKKKLVPHYDPTAGADLEHAAPIEGTAGRPVELDIHATRGADRIFEIVVATRRRGELAYRTTTTAPRGDAHWRARFTPEPSAKATFVEYYIAARDASGATIARIGAPDDPLAIPLAAGGLAAGPARGPWYTRWYVIAGGAAIVAAGTTGAILYARRGPGEGSLPPGTVTVTP